MGLDSPHPLDPADSRDGAPARKATTASMQNLLAQYFANQHFADPHLENSPPEAVAAFDANRIHALSTTRSETRAASSEEAVAASFARLEAAFVAVAVEQTAPPAPSGQDEWPEPARLLVTSLMQERETLREQVHALSMQLHSALDQADNDVLTPTLNRRAFLREVHRAMTDARRYGEDACLIYLDMDSFKSINDAYGHAAGDRALIYVAETLKASVREGDAVGRIGGDEFAVLLRRADLKSSRIKAMKLEAELMMGTFEHDGLHLKTGGSFGVRAFSGQASAEAWLSEADCRHVPGQEVEPVSSHLAAISLLVPDYDEAIAHYCDGLGFDLVEDSDLDGNKRWVLVAPPGTGETRLLLAKATTPEQKARIGDQTGGRVFLILHTDDFERDYSRFAGCVTFMETPRQEAYGRSVSFATASAICGICCNRHEKAARRPPFAINNRKNWWPLSSTTRFAGQPPYHPAPPMLQRMLWSGRRRRRYCRRWSWWWRPWWWSCPGRRHRPRRRRRWRKAWRRRRLW
ncbi:MAG: diguanylate cyclase [Asticcacaulis sp.]